MNVGRLRRPGRVARRVIVGTAVVAVAGGGYAAYAASANGASYRTATATVADVEQTLALSGTVEPAGRADLAFATSGTLDGVDVEAGQKVRAGAVLGTLDDSGLRKQVQQARSTLASARAQLESDQDAQADAVSGTSTGSSSNESVSPSTGSQQTEQPSEQQPEQPADSGKPTGDTTKELAELAVQQKAVTDAQSVVSTALTTAQEALATQQTACAGAFSDEPSPSASADPTASAGLTTSAEAADQACTDALAAVQIAQQAVSDDQDALQDALADLTKTLTAAFAALQASDSTPTKTPTTTPTTTTPSAAPSTTKTPTAASPSTGMGSSMGSPSVTAATLASDQAEIDQARADLVTAEQELAMATVTAPFAGEVVEVDGEVGDSVSSGMTVFVLVSRGTTTVEVSATSTQVKQLAVGQPATVRAAGSDRELVGTVTQVSTIPDDSSYPVTITLRRKHLDIATGLTASVSVVTATADHVVTVPASAVDSGSVQVLDGGTAKRSRVTTGVRGATSVEIVDGLAAGDTVVLADLDAALPTTDDEQTGGFRGSGRFSGGGGFGGTGGPPPGGFGR